MKTVWENLVEQIKTWTRTAAEKAGVITKAAATKAEELSKIGKLKMDIFQLQREQSRLYADLGRIAYQTLEEGKGEALESRPGIGELRQRITTIVGEIKEKELDVERASHLEEPVHEEVPPEKKAAPKKKAAPAKKTTAAKGGGQKGKTAAAKKTGTKQTTAKSGTK